jgi:hypothetical protein
MIIVVTINPGLSLGMIINYKSAIRLNRGYADDNSGNY